MTAPPTTEWGDFSHYRVVGLGDPRRGQPVGYDYRLRATPDKNELIGYSFFPDPPAGELTMAAVATAERYFDMGYRGLAWKVTEGDDYEDPTWRAAYETCVRRGKWFMGYHFARNAIDGARQADWFTSRLRAGGALGSARLAARLDLLCLDQEDTRTPTRAVACTREFTSRVAALHYDSGIIYSGRWYAEPNAVRLDDAGIPPEWRYGWISDYGSAPDTGIVLPRGWPRERVAARQYTSTRPGLPNLPMGCDFDRTLDPTWPNESPGEDVPLTSDDIPVMVEAMNRWATGRMDAGAATPRELLMQWRDVRAAVLQLTDDQTKIIAAVQAGDADIETAIAAIVQNPDVPNDDHAAFARAVITELRDSLNRGEPDQP